VNTRVPIRIKIGIRVKPDDVIKTYDFRNKIFRGFESTARQIPRFPIGLVIIVTTVRSGLW